MTLAERTINRKKYRVVIRPIGVLDTEGPVLEVQVLEHGEFKRIAEERRTPSEAEDVLLADGWAIAEAHSQRKDWIIRS
jgi:hypothetical protein